MMDMALYLLRGLFLAMVAVVAVLYVLPFQQDTWMDFTTTMSMMLLAVMTAAVVIGLDVIWTKKRLSSLSGAFLGLIVGLVGAYALSFVVDLFGLIMFQSELNRHEGPIYNLFQGIKVVIGLMTCYVSTSLILQTKDDFRFVIPYVEFAKQVRGIKPTLVDTSVLIDGRILDIVKTRFFQGSLLVPKFVLNELQLVADSADKLKRVRGRRGLDILNKLQQDPIANVSIEEDESEGNSVDQKLLSLAARLQARLMTNDFNLAKVAAVRNIEVLNLNDLAAALKAVVLPGEEMKVRVVKPGENPQQGVGYLDDGTMVVVENGRGAIGQEVPITITSMIQTSAGRMIFGRIDPPCPPSPLAPTTPSLSPSSPATAASPAAGANHPAASSSANHRNAGKNGPPNPSSH